MDQLLERNFGEELVPLHLLVGLVDLLVSRAGRGEKELVIEHGEHGQDMLAAHHL